MLADIGVRKSESVHENLEELLAIDTKYRDCLLLRKIVKTVQMFQENAYLKSSTMKKNEWTGRRKGVKGGRKTVNAKSFGVDEEGHAFPMSQDMNRASGTSLARRESSEGDFERRVTITDEPQKSSGRRTIEEELEQPREGGEET